MKRVAAVSSPNFKPLTLGRIGLGSRISGGEKAEKDG